MRTRQQTRQCAIAAAQATRIPAPISQTSKSAAPAPAAPPEAHVKRKHESPEKPAQKKPRHAFGDLTNALSNVSIQSTKKQKDDSSSEDNKSVNESSLGPDDVFLLSSQPNSQCTAMPLSQGSNSSSDSDGDKSATSKDKLTLAGGKKKPPSASRDEETDEEDPAASYDYDKEMGRDPFNVPQYASHIFQYYKAREKQFVVGDYMTQQRDLSPQMRAVLVDWMVEVQENFELNHETLYMAVKLVDLFLCRMLVKRDKLQLVGAAAMFVSCKFDERCPPLADDFLYICDDAYTRSELLTMEQQVLITLGFDIGMPSSYRFLRRYAKATKASMETLTLARFILETSLMHYEFVRLSDSFIAAACFLLAIRMRDNGNWTAIHQKYSGYKAEDLEELMWILNRMVRLHPITNKELVTVRNKYSHKIFFEVAKIRPLADPTATPRASTSKAGHHRKQTSQV